jgi:hypothetical protein
MAKAVIASKYVIEYNIPGVAEETRTMVVTARFPLRELARFRRVNPKAKVLRMYDRFTKTEVNLEETNDTPVQ